MCVLVRECVFSLPSTKDVSRVTLAALRRPAGRLRPIFSRRSLRHRPPFFDFALRGDRETERALFKRWSLCVCVCVCVLYLVSVCLYESFFFFVVCLCMAVSLYYVYGWLCVYAFVFLCLCVCVSKFEVEISLCFLSTVIPSFIVSVFFIHPFSYCFAFLCLLWSFSLFFFIRFKNI